MGIHNWEIGKQSDSISRFDCLDFRYSLINTHSHTHRHMSNLEFNGIMKFYTFLIIWHLKILVTIATHESITIVDVVVGWIAVALMLAFLWGRILCYFVIWRLKPEQLNPCLWQISKSRRNNFSNCAENCPHANSSITKLHVHNNTYSLRFNSSMNLFFILFSSIFVSVEPNNDFVHRNFILAKHLNDKCINCKLKRR